MAVAFAYLVLGTILPLVNLRLPLVVGITISIALLMILQLLLVVSLARVQMSSKVCLSVLLPAAGLTIALSFIMGKWEIRNPALLSFSMSMRSLTMMVTGGSLGYLVSFIVREPNLLLPCAVFAAMVDYWSVTWGPLSHMLEKKASVVAAASVQMPALGRVSPVTMIGVGDFLFLALFFGVLYRFNMNAKGTFWIGYALLTVSMFLVLYGRTALPALVPMGAAVIIANYRYFRLRREELLAMLYVGLFLLVAIIGAGFYFLRR